MSGRLLRIRDWEKLAKDSKFRPATMAANCPIGLRQLERFFAKHYAKTPRVWAKELQLKTAKRLIAQGWKNKYVADELGFANESHFCKEFKKHFGSSPQSFARLYDGSILTKPRLAVINA